MAGKNIPDRIINYNGFLDGYVFLGMADVELPNITPMVETLSGAGILGEVETPLLGHIEAMECTINWRLPTKDTIRLAAPGTHRVDFRVSQQSYATASGQIQSKAFRVTMGMMNKELGLGKLEPNATADAGQIFSVAYIKVYLDGVKLLDIDQLASKFEIAGKDYLKDYKKHVGM